MNRRINMMQHVFNDGVLVQEKPFFPRKIVLNKSGKNGMWLNLVLDQSGSMGLITQKTISAVNEFLSSQERIGDPKDVLSVTVFNTGFRQLVSNVKINEFRLNSSNYSPYGGTALYDAIGNSIWNINQTLGFMPLETRPGIMTVIITDGEENSSRQFNNSEIRELMVACEEADWAATFLGADINAFAVGESMGFYTSNSLQFTKGKLSETMSAVGAATETARQMKVSGASVSDMYASNAFYNDKTRGNVL